MLLAVVFCLTVTQSESCALHLVVALSWLPLPQPDSYVGAGAVDVYLLADDGDDFVKVVKVVPLVVEVIESGLWPVELFDVVLLIEQAAVVEVLDIVDSAASLTLVTFVASADFVGSGDFDSLDFDDSSAFEDWVGQESVEEV